MLKCKDKEKIVESSIKTIAKEKNETNNEGPPPKQTKQNRANPTQKNHIFKRMKEKTYFTQNSISSESILQM